MRRLLLSFVVATLVAPVFADAPAISITTDPADLSRWWNRDVNVVVAATDTGGGIGSITCDGVTAAATDNQLAFSVSNDGVTELHCRAADNSGNVSADSVVSIKIDKAPPFIFYQIFGSLIENGWRRDALVLAIASDELSGMATRAQYDHLFVGCDACVPFGDPNRSSTEGANVTWTPPLFFDNAGNCSQLIVGEAPFTPGCTPVYQPGLKLDHTPPHVTLTPMYNGFPRTPNAAGWFNVSPTLHFEATDSISGVYDPAPYPSVYSSPSGDAGFGEGANQTITLHFKDLAGNEATASYTASVDSVPPRVQVSRTPANINGWNNTDVSIHFQPSGSLSPLVAAKVNNVPLPSFVYDQTFTAEGITALTYDLENAAGNHGFTTQFIRIDKTPPEVRMDIFPRPNENGWNRSDVTIRAFGVDELAGTLDPLQSRPFTAEGTDIFTGFVQFRDFAGNSSPLTELPHLNIDKTPPVITLTRDPLPNANGWNNTNVTVHVNATDARSGVAPPLPVDTVLTSSARNQAAQYFVLDRAGNQAEAHILGISIDKDPPVVTVASASPHANAYGWNNTNVRVSFSVSDLSMGTVDANAEVNLTEEGTNLAANHLFVDAAGNSTNATLGGINIDKTPPSFTASRFPLPNAYGWNNTNVTAQFAAADTLSGMDGKTTDEVTVTTEGDNQVAQQPSPFADRAGNWTFARLGGIRIDKAPPNLICFATPSLLWPPNHQLVPVTIGLFFDDGDEYTVGRSGGPAGPMPLLSVISSASTSRGDDIIGWNVGTQDTSGELRAWRASTTPVYTFTYSATDFAGNSATCTPQVAVGRN